ncbi:MAG: MmcQ/YjbR family DNA-binding protein [Planctomycetota bacterium]
MLTADHFRALALALDGATESAHMGHPDFRANGRIFATLTADGERGMVKLTPPQQREAIEAWPAFTAAAGAWGRQGCTLVDLAAARRDVVRDALVSAWENAMAQPAARSRSRAKAPRTRAAPKRRGPRLR